MIKIKNFNDDKNKFDNNEFMNNVKNIGINNAREKMRNFENDSMIDSSQSIRQQNRNNDFSNKNDQNRFENKSNKDNKNKNNNNNNKNNNNFK